MGILHQYYMSLFKMPSKIIHLLEKLQRDFFFFMGMWLGEKISFSEAVEGV